MEPKDVLHFTLSDRPYRVILPSKEGHLGEVIIERCYTDALGQPCWRRVDLDDLHAQDASWLAVILREAAEGTWSRVGGCKSDPTDWAKNATLITQEMFALQGARLLAAMDHDGQEAKADPKPTQAEIDLADIKAELGLNEHTPTVVVRAMIQNLRAITDGRQQYASPAPGNSEGPRS